MSPVKRVHNFNPGPSVLPLPVLEKAQAELLDYQGSGMSVMELSHRSKEFESIIQTAEADLRDLLGYPRQLQDSVFARRCQLAVCHAAYEHAPGRRFRRLYCYRLME